MNWIIIAMFPPLLWAISNFIDKYLIVKYFKGGTIGALLIFSSLMGTFLLPFIYIFNRDVFSIHLFAGILIVASGFLYIMSLIPYIYAMNKDETSVVAPLFQFIPICNYFLAYYFLNEKLSTTQVLASLIIILGAVIISLNIDERKPKFKGEIFFLMFLSSLMLAATTLIFKMVAIEEHFWKTTFWEYVGFTIAMLTLLCIKSYREEFLRVIRRNKQAFVWVNFTNEAITLIGRMIMAFASLLAPLALVWVINGFQPLFIFLIGIILTIFLPGMGKESLRKRHLAQKFVAVTIMFSGAYLLNK
ncbi:MAG: protein of unknown function DUF6 transmembrane [uncultured bacterium]|nr:MAG: protein of unknown function DUF6 transmembrane [uncultured bacterium]